MKRLILKMVLFCALGAVILAGLNAFAIRAGDVFKDGAAKVCEYKRNEVRDGGAAPVRGRTTVLFMGNSKILAGPIPEHFDALSGNQTYSYNLALPALPIGPQYFVLKDYLERNPPPQYIITTLSTERGNAPGLFDKYALQGISMPHELAAYARLRKNKAILMNWLFPIRMYKRETLKYGYAMLLDRRSIRRARDMDRRIMRAIERDRGYYYIRDRVAFPGGRLPDDFMPQSGMHRKCEQFDPFEDPFAGMFFNLTRDQGITVMLVEPPVLEKEFAPCPAMPRQYAAILDRYPTVRMAQNGWNRKSFPNRYFSDPTHLNRDGAERYTEAIYKEFLEIQKTGK
jgi:hypothetical protein